jgi:hypothetical protein
MKTKFNQILSFFPNQWAYSITIFTLGLLAYSAVLMIGSFPFMISVFSGVNSAYLLTTFSLLLYFVYRLSGWLGNLSSLVATLVLFALQLSAVWSSLISPSRYFLLGGLLPISDASSYYQGARNLLEGGTLSVIASWRPIFSSTLAFLLGLTQQNLQVTLAIFVLINALACFLLAREVQQTHGTLSAVVSLSIIFLFYRYYIGTTMTENLGIGLGTVGLAILWRGAAQKQINLSLLGIFILTLALNTRAGAFFILPALVVWGMLAFRGLSPFSTRFLLGSISVIFLGFMLNSIIFKIVGSTEAATNGNFAYTFYGMVVGSNWATVIADYPYLENLSDIERTQAIYKLALEKLYNQPWRIIGNTMQFWRVFLINGLVFTFIGSVKIHLPLRLLSLFTLVQCYRQRWNLNHSVMIAFALGILISVPFIGPSPGVPPMRAYAATIPIISLFPALGLSFIAQKLPWNEFFPTPQLKKNQALLIVFGLILVFCSTLGPILTKILSHTPQFSQISCPSALEAIYFPFHNGTSLHLINDDTITRTYVPNIRISDFKSQLSKLSETHLAGLTQEFVRLEANTTLTNTIDLQNGEVIGLIADSDLIPAKTGIVGACGKREVNSDITGPLVTGFSGYNALFYADSMTLVSNVHEN